MPANRSIPLLVFALFSSPAALAEGYTGDLGLGVFSRQGIYRGESTQTDVLPYVYGEWGSFFGRVDTFGYRVMPLGHGFLEIGTRIVQDQMESDSLKQAGVRERNNSRLLGVSTFQFTPIGAVQVSLMQDFGDSEGMLADASWIGRIKAADWLTLYPELGVELLSSKYTAYYFGTDAGEGGHPAYEPGMALNPYLAIHTSSPLAENWNLAFTLRNKALDEEISNSPIVGRNSRWNAYVAVSYEFK
ncbi:MAG: MipA/OmpV family protein [Gammaproteobacteria bacterium]|nr:MipA/OmpV family protein [Gammaproteobacteria bacterium]MBU1416294.1 MipA/OmpV family protein [Gammaproteobacteria bacterium]